MAQAAPPCTDLRISTQDPAVTIAAHARPPFPLYMDADGDCAHEFWEEGEAGMEDSLHAAKKCTLPAGWTLSHPSFRPWGMFTGAFCMKYLGLTLVNQSYWYRTRRWRTFLKVKCFDVAMPQPSADGVKVTFGS